MSRKIVAQFGGVGGGGNGSPYSPGKSPIGKGGTNTGGHQINVNWDENNTLEYLLNKVREDFDDSDRNFEARLMPFHKDFEANKNYLLTPEERIKEKFRAHLHQYNEFLKEHADNIEKNSIEYINTHCQPKEEHMVTLEVSLNKRRHFDDTKKREFEFEDKTPDQIAPTRTHPILSNRDMERIAIIVRRDRITEENDPDVEQRNIFDISQKNYTPIGRTTILEYGAEEKEYNKKILQEYTPQQQGLLEMKDNFPDYPDPDVLPSNINPKDVSKKPTNIPLRLDKSYEGNLHPNKTPKNIFDRNNMAVNEEDLGQEAMDETEVYKGSQWFGSHSPASFQ